MKYLLLTLIGVLTLSMNAQNDEEMETEEEGASLFLGINIGAFKANKKTAIMYNAGYDYFEDGTKNEGYYGANYYFNNYFFKQAVFQYFKYDYKIVGFASPEEATYQVAMNIGGHAGIKLDESVAVYAELNYAKINFKNVFTVAVANSNDPTLIGQPRLEQIPVFGQESRTNLNVGVQTNYYNDGLAIGYFNFFANVNNAKLEKNYFRINGVNYQILHNNYINGQNGNQNVFKASRPTGGTGFGGGIGTGMKYKFNDKFTFDLNYNALFVRTKMYANLKPFGLNHSLVFRIIWG